MNRTSMSYNSCNTESICGPNLSKSGYDNWQQWANEHQLSRRRGRRPDEHDLLSEHVDPKAELHMQIPRDSPTSVKDRKLPPKEPKKTNTCQRDHKYKQPSSSRRRRGTHGLDSAYNRPHQGSPEAEEKVEDDLVLGCSLKLRISSSSVSLIQAVSGTSLEGSHKGDDWSQALGLRASSSLIREQEEILRQIQGTCSVKRPPNTNTAVDAYVTSREPITVDHSMSKTTHPTSGIVPCDIESTSCSQSIHVDGRRVKILPESRVERAVECGEQVILVKCIGCEKQLLVTGDMSMIYCPSCGTLSSTELAKRLASNNE